MADDDGLLYPFLAMSLWLGSDALHKFMYGSTPGLTVLAYSPHLFLIHFVLLLLQLGALAVTVPYVGSRLPTEAVEGVGVIVALFFISNFFLFNIAGKPFFRERAATRSLMATVAIVAYIEMNKLSGGNAS